MKKKHCGWEKERRKTFREGKYLFSEKKNRNGNGGKCSEKKVKTFGKGIYLVSKKN